MDISHNGRGRVKITLPQRCEAVELSAEVAINVGEALIEAARRSLQRTRPVATYTLDDLRRLGHAPLME